MRLYSRLFLIIMACLVLSGCIGSRPLSYSFNGIVIDSKTQKPIPNIRLTSLSMKGDGSETTVTDKDGKFHFKGLHEKVFDYPMRGVSIPPGAIVIIHSFELPDHSRYKEKSFSFDKRIIHDGIVISL